MKFSKKRATAAIAGSGLVAAFVFSVAASSVAASPDPAGGDQIAKVRATAQSAVAAWQSLFVEEPQTGVVAPSQAKPYAAQLSAPRAVAFVTAATRSAKTLFTGRPLLTLEQSLKAEAQTSSPAAIAAAARAQGVSVELSGGYTICVAAGAHSFHFTQLSVTGGSAVVDLVAYAWTTNVDHFSDGHTELDTARGAGKYELKMTESPSGDWLVTAFDAAPVAS